MSVFRLNCGAAGTSWHFFLNDHVSSATPMINGANTSAFAVIWNLGVNNSGSSPLSHASFFSPNGRMPTPAVAGAFTCHFAYSRRPRSSSADRVRPESANAIGSKPESRKQRNALYFSSDGISVSASVVELPYSVRSMGICSALGGTSTSKPRERNPSAIQSCCDFEPFSFHHLSQSSASLPASWLVMCRMAVAE